MRSLIVFHVKHYFTQSFIFLLIPCLLSAYCHNNAPNPSPSPSLNFLDHRVSKVYPIIQSFKDLITSDPFNVTKTWVGSDICNYTGFYCAHPPDNHSATALAAVDLNGLALAAPTIGGFIDQLPDLAFFHANSNKFSGTIPEKLSELPFLFELDLSNNRFSGTFPLQVLQMHRLSFLDLRYNFFNGSVPCQVFLKNLDVLFLNNNRFSQHLPENLGSTPALYLSLANNKFVGSIPKSIGNISSWLREVLLLNNSLTGCLPYELGYLGDLKVFDASKNQLTGPLPCSLGCLKKIEVLNLSENLLYGTVPELLCQLEKLVNLSLSNNYFTEVGSSCRKMIDNGVLDVRRNCIYDLPDQRSEFECEMFFSHSRSCPSPSTYDIVPCSNSTSSPPPPPANPNRNSSSYTCEAN